MGMSKYYRRILGEPRPEVIEDVAPPSEEVVIAEVAEVVTEDKPVKTKKKS